ncbi:sugar transferase [Thalassobacillus hwangdonensis]|uniref:Sugar transferase n=1 Tax=Thalassobacillus hwangdonensis TaxID=546108 RepID=A0ABW3L5C6_9BACI
MSLYQRFLKRSFDIVFALLIGCIGIPMCTFIAIILRLSIGKPVIFKQLRPGKHEKIFHIYKFRTMTNDMDADGTLKPDEERLTSFGKFLRKTSMDELPQLWNVIKGDISLVGPRPLLISYLPYFTEKERKRFSVKPGITGLAQISGRRQLNWEERLAKDVEYVENWSLWLDCKILFKTCLNVIKQDGGLESNLPSLQDLNVERKGMHDDH